MPDILGEKYDATLSLPYYRAQLQWTNPARFQYMDVPTQQATRVRLINTLALLRCEAQEHLGKKHTQQLLKVISEIDTCLSLLDAVSLQASSLLDDCNGALNITYLRDEAKAFLKAIKPNCSPSTNVSDIIEQDIGVLNRMRLLHFVFGTILFEVVFDVLAADNRHFSYETQLKSGITLFGPPMGFLSVFIYLLRFFWS